MVIWKETFVKKGSNTSAIVAGNVQTIQFQETARKNENLPHNAITITNLTSSCTLFIFLDDYQVQTKPDYVLFPNSNIALGVDDGISFETIFIKNTHASTQVEINEIKYRLSTIKPEVD